MKILDDFKHCLKEIQYPIKHKLDIPFSAKVKSFLKENLPAANSANKQPLTNTINAMKK